MLKNVLTIAGASLAIMMSVSPLPASAEGDCTPELFELGLCDPSQVPEPSPLLGITFIGGSILVKKWTDSFKNKP